MINFLIAPVSFCNPFKQGKEKSRTVHLIECVFYCYRWITVSVQLVASGYN